MTTTIKKLQFAEGTSVTQPTDLTISEVIKEFVQYADDAAYESANPGFSDGATYYNTTSNLLRTYSDGTWVDLAYATLEQTLTNKTFGDAPTFTQITTPSTPDAGLVKLYPKSDGNFYKLDENGVEVVVGSGAGGSGEKNYIENPSASAAITDWTAVGDVDVARTTTAAELPREHTTGSGIKITADANTQSVADYVYYDFSLDDVDLSKKLKIQWSQKITGSYVAGDLAVVITTQADRTTALHTPTTTAIPAADGVFETYFDASTTATLSLVIRATTDMATDAGIVISDVVVGPGVNVQGAVVGEWTAYTPTLTGFGTPSSVSFYYRRAGSGIDIYGSFVSGVPTATEARVTLPSGLTATSLMVSNQPFGNYFQNKGAATQKGGPIFAEGSAAYLTFGNYGVFGTTAVSGLGKANGDAVIENGDRVQLFAANIPIAEWAGSGTVNLGANNVEYAYNTSTSTTANDTTSFAYGPAGAAVQAITADLNRRVRFQTPIQPTDNIEVQIDADANGTWLTVPVIQNATARNIDSLNRFNGVSYGVAWRPINSTDVDVYFGQYRSASDAATFGGAGSTWTGVSNAKWRVVKSTAGVAVGFGAATADSMGLVSREASETVSSTFTFNGSGGTSSPINVSVVRIGNAVIVCITAAIVVTSGTSSTELTANTALPVWARPAAQRTIIGAYIRNNGSAQATPGMAQVSTSGIITISRDGTQAAFTNASSCGTQDTLTITYTIN